MAATLTRERFTGPDWVFERKLDGIRLLAFKQGASVRLLSRNRLAQNEVYPSFVEAVARLPVHDVILDGEATGVWNARDDVGYHLFDIMWLEGRDLTSLPLDARRELLQTLVIEAPLRLVPRLDHPEPWELAKRGGWEGVIAKRADSLYTDKRSKDWLKFKCEQGQELVIGGFTPPKGTRIELGALLVGVYDGDKLRYAGKVGTGFNRETLRMLAEKLRPLERADTPFANAPRFRDVTWVEPSLVAQVGFAEWTNDGRLRHPRYLGLRDDKAASEVVREGA